MNTMKRDGVLRGTWIAAAVATMLSLTACGGSGTLSQGLGSGAGSGGGSGTLASGSGGAAGGAGTAVPAR